MRTQAMPVVEIEDLHVYYGAIHALKGVSLTVNEGEIVTLIGANGAGKSTLLDSIAGLLRPTAGDVRFDGASVSALAPNTRTRLGISLVPEGRRVFPSLSVIENLLVGSYPKRPGPWSVDRVFALFPFLAERARSRGWMLSGGEQQALAIGRALMANPRLLLLDEVSLGLAPVAVKRLYEALPSIMAEGTTLVLVEQDIGQALKVASRIYCLLEGRVSLEGRPQDFTRDRVVEAYFGMAA
jgi:branched-chain amino acid transport system ATP-binding protein